MSRAVAVALLGLAALAGCDEPDRSPASPAARVDTPAAPREVAELTPPPAPDAPAAKPPNPADDRAAVVTPPPAAKGPRSHVIGRVVDDSGAPLADVHLMFDAVDGEWAAGVDVPIIDKRYGVQGFETKSDATGRFDFDLPVPTANWISLIVKPDAYHDIAGRNFGPAGGRDEPRLVAGDNDLGEFKLATTGAISGSVIDTAGNPIGGAEVRLDGSFPGGYGRQCESDASGAFTVEHVPAGSYGVEALHKGHQLAKRPDVAVAVNATTPIGAITLATASTISGVVIDELGTPVAGARVWGWPVGSGRGSGARADAQGRFVVALAQTEPHVFQVEAEGFAKYEEQHFGPDRAEHAHAVGANDVRIVMKRPVMTTFVVLDAHSSSPVTKYGVKLTFREIETPSGRSHRSGGEPEYDVAEHANGEFTCEADPALHGFVITAPGHAPFEGVVTHESASSPRCVVKLATESGLRGRVTLDGKPVARAEIKLYPASLLRFAEEDDFTSAANFDEQDYYWSDYEGPQDLVFVLPQPTKHWTEADGTFAISGLSSAEYRLEILGSAGARKALDPVAVSEGGSLDLGEIALTPSGSLRGRILVPAGVSPERVGIGSYCLGVRGHAETDASGAFVISGLPAGTQHVTVAEIPGRLTWGKSFAFVLAPNETKDVVLDLSDRVGCFVQVEVRVNGEHVKGLDVYLRSASDEKQGARFNPTDAQGIVSGWEGAIGVVDARVDAPSRMPMGRFPRVADLVAGGKVTVSLDVACGRLAFEWPTLPSAETLGQVEFSAPATSGSEACHPCFFAEHRGAFDADISVPAPNRCEFAWVAPGEYDWTLRVISRSPTADTIQRYYRKKVTITARTTAACLVTEADRVSDEK